MTTPKDKKQQVTAKERAEVILQFRSGFLTATEGAALLGVSRKIYYKWENRALQAMLSELEERRAGRPETSVHQQNLAELEKKLEALQKEKDLLRKQLELKDLVHQIQLDETVERVKSSTAKGSKKSLETQADYTTC